jgi:hypothetical protein
VVEWRLGGIKYRVRVNSNTLNVYNLVNMGVERVWGMGRVDRKI